MSNKRDIPLASARGRIAQAAVCGALPEGRPKRIAGLEVRQWECVACGCSHDRDVNAALNIVRIGLDTLAEGALP